MADKKQTKRADIIVIGAGASGCMAAAAASLQGASVLLIEKEDRIGRKLYATGNGRCNLTNKDMREACYHTGGDRKILPYIERFGPSDLCAFWQRRGVFFHDRDGYVYPRTDQAATFVQAMEKELERCGVQILTNTRAVSVLPVRSEGFRVRCEQRDPGRKGRRTPASFEAASRKLILSAGGLAGPQFGCTGDGYLFAGELGHGVLDPLPALTPLRSSDPLLKTASGVRAAASIALLVDGFETDRAEGEIQFTADSISGIPAFQISAKASRALAQGRRVQVRLDLLPEFTDPVWETEKERRLSEDKGQMLGRFYGGLINAGLLQLILRRRGLQAENKAYKLSQEILGGILDDMRTLCFDVCGTGGFEKAQTTSGGVPLQELDDDLESKRIPGLFFTGETVDVDGLCGGYNLQWAMTGGFLAGSKAGADVRHGM
ncbi:MAG: aminoacetone oxidase family FAD-binding enzyme [Lachnospiraceae bacterium]|nr:aminoacetone oxidase family FAD-binding enzyme [Lachnospiraceae bacterium]